MGRKKKRPPCSELPLPGFPGPVADSHCHLDPEETPELDAVLERAWAAGLRFLVVIGSGFGLRGARAALELAAREPRRIFPTVGLHPHEARLWPEVGEELARLAARPEVVALGELGLDFHYDLSPRPEQRRVLALQVRLARELGLPVVVHDRESGGETLRILRDEGAFEGRVVVHCFSEGPEQLAAWLEAGAWVSFSGIVTYPQAVQVREAARLVPRDRLLVETDSPYLSPVPCRGRPNEPARVRYTLAELARLRGEPAEELARATTANAVAFYGLPRGLLGEVGGA